MTNLMRDPGWKPWHDERDARRSANALAPTLKVTLADFKAVATRSHDLLPLGTYSGDRLRAALTSGSMTLGMIGRCASRCDVSRWGIIVRHTTTAGAHLAVLRCIVCGGKIRDLGAAVKVHADFMQLPVWADGSTDAPPCAHCGSNEGTELHHWAPWHLFPNDAHAWPTSYLCRPCHQLWHRVVTPNMGRKGAA